METLTPRRRKVVNFIRAFTAEKGYPPSVRDITRGCDLRSTSVTHFHLTVLERQGYIQRSHLSRGIVLTDKNVPDREGRATIPLLGTIAAGQPIPVPTANSWTAVPEESIKLPDYLVDQWENVYALRVKGTSMIDSLIADGDIVIMQAETLVDQGDAVAVWLKDRQEVTLKKIYYELGRIRLQPANSLMEPIYCKSQDIEVQGRVIAVLRKFAR